jgi:hypothetical protein
LLDPLVSQARELGFICQCQESNYWLILPQHSNQKWKLEQVEDRWILLVGDVAQLRLDPEEAIAFLESVQLENNQ